MSKKINRVLFFWLPILALYLYAFNAVLEVNIIKKIVNYFPLWGWLVLYFITMILVRFYLKSIAKEHEEEQVDDYTEKTMKVNSDIILLFLFSVISFVLIMLLLGRSLNSAMNLF